MHFDGLTGIVDQVQKDLLKLVSGSTIALGSLESSFVLLRYCWSSTGIAKIDGGFDSTRSDCKSFRSGWWRRAKLTGSARSCANVARSCGSFLKVALCWGLVSAWVSSSRALTVVERIIQFMSTPATNSPIPESFSL